MLFRSLGGVDRYVFHKVIGEGGQGIVWEVHDNQLGRRVALKKVKPTCTRKPLYSDMLIKEARKTGCINHTGAVPVHDIGQDEDGSPYFTMQLVRGERLTDRLKSVKYDGMSSREFLSAIRPLLRNIIDVCNTLQFAYDQNGIIHRDIKPDNIMVDRYGETLILDWGMGKAVEDKSKLDDASTVLFTPASGEPNEETQAGSIKGTLAYMSPEQAQAMSALLDHRTDVYLVGATLYRILVGRPPHQGGEWEMVRLAAANEFTSPRQINPLVPEELEAICLKAMKTRPEDRYENATALADDLENWLADEPVSVAPEGVLKKSERWLRRNSKGVVASLIGLTATTLLLAVFSQLLWKAERQARDSRNIASSVLDDTVGYVIDDVLSGIPNTDDKRIKILEGVIESVEKNSASHSGDQVLNLDLQIGRAHV